jgi:hypothetical protein
VDLPAGFQDLGLDRFMYKPESCRAKPLVGFLIGVQEFGRDKADKDEWWDALIVRTTQPTLAVQKDEGGNEITIEVPVGEEVMIPMTDKLEKLRGYAKHPELMAEFFIQPVDKIVLEVDPKGNVKKSMWRYKAGGKDPVPRVATTSWDALPASGFAAKPAVGPASNTAALPG